MSEFYYQQRTSDAITWLRFPLIFLIIMLHSYSVIRLSGNHETYFKIVYPFALWLGETGVPGFFFISGYLFFVSNKDYKQKLRTRIHTLLMPYFLWNVIMLSAYLITYMIGYPQEINNRSLYDYTLSDYLRLFWDRGSYDNGNFVPLLCPLWYIRNLFIVAVLSPILYYLIKYLRELFIFALAIWWLYTYDNAFIQQTLLFFSLGSYFSIFRINPLELFNNKKKFFLILFTIFAICDIAMHTIEGTSINLQTHRLSLIFNIPALFLFADYCVNLELRSDFLPNAAFIVFCVHYPIVVAIRKLSISFFESSSEFTQIMLYFACIFIATITSLSFFQILNKYFPKIKKILSGNR